MKIILLRDIAKLGKRGEIKEVPAVYAVNVLIKKQDAVEATPGEIAKWKQKEESQKHRKDVAAHSFQELISRLRSERIIIENKKHDDKGQLFARVMESEIAEKIYAKTNISIGPKQIVLEKQIKSLGKHEIMIKQGVQKEKVEIEVR